MPHNIEIPDYVIERIMAKRGKLNVFDRFEAAKTAFLVIDMQNFYVTEVDTAISIVPNINRIATACREKGVPVIWVIMTVADEVGAPSQWRLYHEYFFTDAKGPPLKIEFSFAYLLDGQGTLKIRLHHSALPYRAPPA